MNTDDIKKIVRKNKNLISNFSYLSVLQLFNLLIPLLVYPYLIRVLGSEVFGKVIFAQAIISYFVILVNFGFNISGAKSISIHRDNPKKIATILSSIFIIKTVLFLLSIFILFGIIFIVKETEDYQILLFLTLWMCVYDILFPIWYFQGIEKMKYITYITLTMKVFFFVLIFIFVTTPADYLRIPIINGIGAILAGSIAMYIIVSKHKIKLYIPSIIEIKEEVKAATPIFISNISVQLYVASNKVIVGTFLGMSSVTYYDLAEKILAVLKMPQVILSQTVFPKISKDKNITFIKKTFNISLLINSILFIIAFILADFLVTMIGGTKVEGAEQVLRILLITIPIIGMSNIFGIQMLIPFGYHKDFSRGIVVSGLLYFLMILFIYTFLEFTNENVAYVTVITEGLVTLFLFYLCRKNNLW